MYKFWVIWFVPAWLGLVTLFPQIAKSEDLECEILAVELPLITVQMPNDGSYKISEANLISKDPAVKEFLRKMGMLSGTIGKIENVKDSQGYYTSKKEVYIYTRAYEDGFSFDSGDFPLLIRVHTLSSPGDDGRRYRVSLGPH